MEFVIQKRLKTILKKLGRKEILYCICLFIFGCATNIIAARYYRLLEKERPIFLGLRGIDSVAADKYLNLPSPTERKFFYDQYWQGRDGERQEFERRAEYAFKEFGKYAPLSDERIPIYVKYGKPTRRYVIFPEKKAGIVTREYVNPAEVWTYKNEGIEFDFIRFARAYKIIAQSRFGDSVIIPYLKEEESNVLNLDTTINNRLKFDIAFGRFRQSRNLVRLEIYARLMIDDTTGCRIARRVKIYDRNDSLITDKINLLIPVDGDKDYFYDEINTWLSPQKYRILVEYSNLKSRVSGRKEFFVDLIDYKDDAKKISDLVFATLIDNAGCDGKFYKPVGRVIPLVQPILVVSTPFYFYHEVYNLMTKNGEYLLKTDYEIYNKEKMQKEIVDIMTQTKSDAGDVGYIGAKYHPMDLSPGSYIIVARTTDLLSGEQYSAVAEFVLVKGEK